MYIFTLSYGLTLLKESFQLMMAHKKTLIYMCIARLLAGAVAVIAYAYGFHGGLSGEIDMVIAAFFIVPLIYHASDIKKGVVSSVGHNIDKIPLHWVAIGWNVLFAVFFISSWMTMKLMMLHVVIQCFLTIILIVFGLLFEYMLVSVVLDKVSVTQGFNQSWSIIKQTMYSIVSCIVGSMIMYLLLGVLVPLVLSLFLIPIGLVTSASTVLAHVELLSEVAMFIVRICYSTTIAIFQTLLYLKYKEVAAAEKAVTSAQNVDLVPEQ